MAAGSGPRFCSHCGSDRIEIIGDQPVWLTRCRVCKLMFRLQKDAPGEWDIRQIHEWPADLKN